MWPLNTCNLLPISHSKILTIIIIITIVVTKSPAKKSHNRHSLSLYLSIYTLYLREGVPRARTLMQLCDREWQRQQLHCIIAAINVTKNVTRLGWWFSAYFVFTKPTLINKMRGLEQVAPSYYFKFSHEPIFTHMNREALDIIDLTWVMMRWWWWWWCENLMCVWTKWDEDTLVNIFIIKIDLRSHPNSPIQFYIFI